MELRWVDGFEIRTSVRDDEVTISANREGLLSLAHILMDLANSERGNHVHLDEFNSLEDGSAELIIERAG